MICNILDESVTIKILFTRINHESRLHESSPHLQNLGDSYSRRIDSFSVKLKLHKLVWKR